MVGQTRPCPKCQTPILIVVPEEVSPPSMVASEPLPPTVETALPTRLEPRHWYLICDPESVVASWQHQDGWQVRVGAGSGFTSARRNAAAIPDQGVFALVELVIGATESGFGPRGLRFFGITKRGGLSAIGRGEEEILNDLDGPVALTRPQRTALLEHLRRATMYTFWSESSELLDFLASPTPHVDTTSVWIRSATKEA